MKDEGGRMNDELTKLKKIGYKLIPNLQAPITDWPLA